VCVCVCFILCGIVFDHVMVTGRKTTTKATQSKVGKGSGEGYEEEEFNIRRRSKPENMPKRT